ncbi:MULTISPECIES: extracellular solute-binding protein [unclassified Beijerinckia]|uniref:ABC transporter substrate-binding protein n=1 Tax=unclassified Beijerinckia TaxID=2638183 RepID=UPI00089CC71C|nr:MULTISPECIES: extracellular solute-binding protein [unclassified Beijerinckia]MDH7794244.1 ABC-type Fe3+ transport system substrate-binding protein [Beijerinckia sp. GAS462]SEB56691.1 ABC-type Fe3+ transport system, substrate-binding protein [Beijerinckia sp. 28-YEA-48]
MKASLFQSLCLALGVLTSGTLHAETDAERYEAAKQEKSLVIYAGGPVAPNEKFAREFEKAYPGISVTVVGGFSNVLNEKINSQIKAKKLEVDLAIFQTVQDLVGWKKDGVLLNFKPDGYEQIIPALRDPDGAFTTTRVSLLTYGSNTNLIAGNARPKSALDFLDPKYNGKLITCYPADDDATLYVFYTIVQKYGWNYMDRYMANKPKFVQGHLGVARGLADGSSSATFDATINVEDLRKAGQPVEMFVSEQDETPAFTLTAGIFKDAPHTNAAKLFLNWYMAPEQQRRTGSFSARTDVGPPEGFQPLSSYRLANNYRELVSNDALMTELRARFEKYTGPVVNTGGVR